MQKPAAAAGLRFHIGGIYECAGLTAGRRPCGRIFTFYGVGLMLLARGGVGADSLPSGEEVPRFQRP